MLFGRAATLDCCRTLCTAAWLCSPMQGTTKSHTSKTDGLGIQNIAAFIDTGGQPRAGRTNLALK